MNIITQDLENRAIKIAKETANNIFLNKCSKIIEAIFSPISSITVEIEIRNIMTEIYKEVIAKLDEMYFNSEYRKNNFYASIKKERTIIKLFGELQFTRYYYVDKDKKNGFFFIDKLFNFESYKTYDECVRAILIDNSTNNNVNNTALKSDLLLHNFDKYLLNNFKANIPRQTIYNWLKEWNIPKVNYDFIDTNDNNLYVMVDEKWIHEQIRLATLSDEERKKRHYIMSKCFVTFTGASIKNNRKSLLNRHIFLTSSDNPWKEFTEEIYNIYNYENFKNIYLLSDSGAWILSGANELKMFKENKLILNTCEFHAKQYISRITRNKEKRKALFDAIYEKKDKNEFIKLTDEIIENSNNGEKKEKYKNYILNHWKTILNMKDRIIKSSMEAHISHYVAASFGSRPKGYSRKRIEKYLKLHEYKENGINIMDLYLKSYNNKENSDFVYNKTEVSFSLFEKNSSVIPVKYSGDPISIILNNIAFN